MNVRRMAGLLGVVVAASFASAEVTPEINTGSKALLFSFSGLSFLGAGEYNGGIGGKYYLMDQLALRASLGLGMAKQDAAGAYGYSSASNFSISAGAEYHLSFSRVSPYVGGVIGFSTTSTKIVDSAGGADRTRKNIPQAGAASVLGYTPGKAFVVGGIGGIEFFITKEISLSGEYQLGWNIPMGYKQETVAKTTAQTQTTTVDVPGLSEFGISNAGALTLAVYF